ncbi:MAG: hypothetical protein IJW03_04265 [Clostridia bacterium]|nr:hypothetical protein [Clostridia bacterium]
MKGKTNFKRLIACLLLSLVLMLSFSVAVSAEESGNGENSSVIAENDAVLSENVENTPEIVTESDENVGNGENELSNIFADIYNEISKYAAEIISALTLIGTLILSFAYKKGLLPLVSRGVAAIQQSVAKIKDDTENGVKNTQTGLDSVSERLGEVENSLALFKGTLDTLEEKLQCEAEYVKERKRMGTVMLSQIDMLYDIFMASALPQYQKDAVGRRVQMMKEELELYDKIAEK